MHAASASSVADEALRRIPALYAVEQQGVGSIRPNAWRCASAWPYWRWLKCTLGSCRTHAPSPPAAALLRPLTAFKRDAGLGTLPIDNNPVENAIRPIAIGKKTWMFTGSERAGHRAAAIQSLFATAKLNGHDLLRWLADVLERLPTCPNSQIDSLLPVPDFIQA